MCIRDSSKDFIKLAKRRFSQFEFSFSGTQREYEIHEADANDLLRYLKPDSVDICITSPPYWDILTQKRTADYKEIRHYGNLEKDLGRISDYSTFLNALENVFKKVYQVLRPSKYCIVIVMDLRKKEKFYMKNKEVYLNWAREVLEIESAELSAVPTSTVKLEDKDARKLLKLIDALDDLDDVRRVHSNFEVDDALLEAYKNE